MDVGFDPKTVHVLVAITKGADSLGKIAGFTGLSKNEVESILLSLKIAGLVDSREVKGLFRRRTVYYLTEKGVEEVERIKEKLREVGKDIENIIRRGEREEAEKVIKEYEDWLPMMVMWGLVDSMLLFNMLGMLGMVVEGFPYSLEEQEDYWEI